MGYVSGTTTYFKGEFPNLQSQIHSKRPNTAFMGSNLGSFETMADTVSVPWWFAPLELNNTLGRHLRGDRDRKKNTLNPGNIQENPSNIQENPSNIQENPSNFQGNTSTIQENPSNAGKS